MTTKKFKLGKLAHICIAVKSIPVALKVYQEIFGLKLITIQKVDDEGVRVAMFKGKPNVELIEPLHKYSKVNNFLSERGEGMHHVAYYVDDLEGSIEYLKEKGMALIDEKPRFGYDDKRIAFLHPKSTHGALIELIEEEGKTSI